MPQLPADHLQVILAGNTEFVLWETLIELERSTLEILREVDKEVTKDDRGTVDWEVIRAGVNSPLTLTVRPVMKGSPIDERHKIIDASVSGLNTLSTRRARPRYFSDPALESAKKLANLYDSGALKIEYRTANRSVVPKRIIVKHVDDILSPTGPPVPEERVRAPRKEIGSLQGVVTILKSGYHDFFSLKEFLSGSEVRCMFPDSLDSAVRSAWKKRVRLQGTIHYSAEGVPQSIDVESIRELPLVIDLPQFKDFSIDITGGIESSEYIRGFRDGD